MDDQAYALSIAAYAELREHAAGCLGCLGEFVLTLVDFRVRGDLGFEPTLCPLGETLMATLEAAVSVDDGVAVGSIRTH